jgi:GST-like protein
VTWRVLATKGCGSAIFELALTVAKLPYEREEHHYGTPEGRAALAVYNQLTQVPTVIMPDGSVMTESLAISIVIDELVPAAKLLPPPGDPQRAQALRWLTFLVAAIYPTFTYGDEFAKWTVGEELRTSTNAHREKLWRHLDGVAVGPWFLGERFSVIDLYICVMSYWRPSQPWFAEHAPKLHAISLAIAKLPELAPIVSANFG